MVQYEIHTGTLSQLSTFYQEWDMEDYEKLTNWHALTSLDKGKYIMFDDGSNLYARIELVTMDAVKTSAGTHRIKDIIHCAKPKYRHWGYSGAKESDESFEVRPASKNEKAKCRRMIGGHQPRTMTRRVRMLVLEDLAEQAKDNGINANYIMSRLKEWSDGNGQHAYKSLVTQARIQGIEIEKALDGNQGAQLSLAQKLGISNSVQDTRKGKLPSMGQLKKIANAEETQAVIIETMDAVEK